MKRDLVFFVFEGVGKKERWWKMGKENKKNEDRERGHLGH